MDYKLKDQVKEKILSEIGGLLDEHMGSIDEAMQAQLMEHQSESQFKYPVSLGVKLEPYGCECKVTASLKYTINKKDESVGAMASNQPDLFKEG